MSEHPVLLMRRNATEQKKQRCIGQELNSMSTYNSITQWNLRLICMTKSESIF